MVTTIKYDGSTASALDHYFGNCVAPVRIFLIDKKGLFSVAPKDYGEIKREFIHHLNQVLESQRPEYANVKREDLAKMVRLAEGDWSDVRTIKELYRAYYDIKKMPFEEEKLFPGESGTMRDQEDRKVTTSYNRSAENALGYYFGNKVAIARIWLLDDKTDRLPDKDYEKIKKEFIAGLNKALESQVPESADALVKRQDLIEMVRLAEGDWSDVETLRGLYRAYFNITTETFDEGRLFPSESREFPGGSRVGRLLRGIQNYFRF